MQERQARNITIGYLVGVLEYLGSQKYEEDIVGEDPESTKDPSSEFYDREQWVKDTVDGWMDEFDALNASATRMSDYKDKTEAKTAMSKASLIEELYDRVPIGSSFNLSSDIKVIAVPGGWIHTAITHAGITSVFVPNPQSPPPQPFPQEDVPF